MKLTSLFITSLIGLTAFSANADRDKDSIIATQSALISQYSGSSLPEVEIVYCKKNGTAAISISGQADHVWPTLDLYSGWANDQRTVPFHQTKVGPRHSTPIDLKSPKNRKGEQKLELFVLDACFNSNGREICTGYKRCD
jgi:hypothetical protein